MLLTGNKLFYKIKNEIIQNISERKQQGLIIPKLSILRVGERAEDIAYESSILKYCSETGIEADVIALNQNISMTDFINTLNRINEDKNVHGILIFRPLPEQLDQDIINRTIKPEKDIDCMNPINAEKVFEGSEDGIPPCTPEAVITLLKHYNIELSGKNVVIVNRSMVLGKPLAMLFLIENSTVTICHSKTVNLAQITARADIVVTGIGKSRYFGKEYFNKDSIVIDVGINEENGSIYGDVNFKEVSEHVAAITPVPGGVGTITSIILLKHVLKAMEMQQ
ncbi:MAG: bifunctional 5,10-methylenetetrahydrofolate dehydrogenase/5,10-methenyltetrahydrofolate cyclohydrolase [Anaerovoracaceae bacterium]|jgi:methylenetetrahydrofolate dehydrogenase (NADP+)/methenyltetrahydrofolate cyclohydrolase|nr:bifunctional 5,10-methylenetetrahydrofolate dehydrogenase/5,10-methenyltetrahydrofolate cyclohydrolase [Clostridiales bacterium]